MALTAYTMVGAGLTPALLAAFLWKRVTVAGGVASIATGMGVTLFITVANSIRTEQLLSEQYIIIPAASASILVLLLVSLATPPSPPEKWKRFYTKDISLEEAIKEQQAKSIE
jgi:solute:Na+ symporter, SSS family